MVTTQPGRCPGNSHYLSGREKITIPCRGSPPSPPYSHANTSSLGPPSYKRHGQSFGKYVIIVRQLSVHMLSNLQSLNACFDLFPFQGKTWTQQTDENNWKALSPTRCVGHKLILQVNGDNNRFDLPLEIITYHHWNTYRIAGKTVLCYPLTFSASDFYLSHDLALVAASVRSDLR